MLKRILTMLTTIFCAAAITACGSTPSKSAEATHSGYGVVDSVTVAERSSGGPGLGAVAGGIVGGVLGNQVGSGRGQTAATIAGAVGGAYAGNEIEKRRQSGETNTYRLSLRMNDGSYQTVTDDTGTFRVGDKVRVTSDGKAVHR